MYLLLISTFLFCEAALSAEIVDLNQENIKDFVKNKYAVGFFCDIENHRKNCDNSTAEFQKAADLLKNENKFTIAFGKMDYIKNKWINMQVNKIDECLFIFFHYGRYEKFWVRDAETIVSVVKRFKNYADGDPNYFHWEYKDWKEEALVIDLNRKNIEEFVKNKYAFAFFCDFEDNKFCEKRKNHFLTAADILTEEKIPIKFSIMDQTKNKWIQEKFQFGIDGDKFMFFCQGRYTTFWDAAAEGTVKSVKKYKKECDQNPKSFHLIYNKRL